MSELEQALSYSNKVLDTPYSDPDGDVERLARQFQRSLELTNRYLEALEKIIWIAKKPSQSFGSEMARILITAVEAIANPAQSS